MSQNCSLYQLGETRIKIKVIEYLFFCLTERYYYEKYTDAQIKTVGELLLLWRNKYGIPLNYKDYMFDFSSSASELGTPGVWTHCSFRRDKTDCHPQTELIEMLKALETL